MPTEQELISAVEEEKKDFFAGEQSVAIFDDKTEDDATDDDNLFDLIDSMYETREDGEV